MSTKTNTNPAETSGNVPERIDRDQVVEFILLTMREGLSYKEAAEKIGVSDRTTRNWRASPWWPTAMLAAEAAMRDEYTAAGLACLYAEARAGNWKAADALVKHMTAARAPAAPARATASGPVYGTRAGRPAARTFEDDGEDPAALSVEELRALAHRAEE